MSPYFTIITPVLNGLPYLNTFFLSLQSQKFCDWEALVVDDGSSDGSFSELKQIAKDDSRFKILTSLHSLDSRSFPGPYKARNFGLSLSTGKYICFHDIDDFWSESFLVSYYNYLCLHPSTKLLFSSYIKANSSLTRGYVKPSVNTFSTKIQSNIWNPIAMITACVSSDVAKSVAFQPVNHEDYIYWHSVLSLLSCDEVSKLNEPLSIYRSSPHSLSSNKFRVLLWWIRCYRIFGYPLPLAWFLLSFKIIAELLELLFVKCGLIRSFYIVNIL